MMDPTLDVSDKFQEANTAARQRFESFKLGGGPSSNLPSHFSKPSHGRSRSRNNSISSISSMSALSISTSTNSVVSTNDMLSNTPSFQNGHSKRPSSHHRRRSSVSTRRESAEMMGVSLPDLPVSKEDNINFGDKDSIRRRALWALEGKPDLAFSKVEIPELSTPDLSKKTFEFPTKPSFPPGNGGGGFGGGLSSLMGKRDSFGKLVPSSSSAKDQLHTLVEEEEEEEEEEVVPQVGQVEAETEAAVNSVIKSPIRPRPASLNLRPLSLVSGSVVSSAPGNLPTPTLTPSPRPVGLRSLALASSPSSNPFSPSYADVTTMNTTKTKRLSVITTPSSSTPVNSLARRFSIT
ncbi:hypothetical protein SERLA73DRAFT_166106, partial [Serpula lacrymans var. lacrymans S7.3]